MKKDIEKARKLIKELNMENLPGSAYELASFLTGFLATGKSLELSELPAFIEAYRQLQPITEVEEKQKIKKIDKNLN
jgi:hypothetical protein